MAVFISNAITDRGRILLGEAQVGATLEATRIVMGSGYIPSGSTAATMTAVVAPVIELAINKKKRAGDGTVTFGGAFSNETITEAFYFREFALFARVQYADGTYSDEALYSYGNAGGNADLIPAYSTSTVVEKQMDLVVWVGNETQVNLTVGSGLYTPHAEKHAADGEDPITPAMIDALPTASKVITTMPKPTGEASYFVVNGGSDFPYAHGRLDIRFGSYPGEYTAKFRATGNDQRTFHAFYGETAGAWSDWSDFSGGLVDYDLIGDSAELHILNWAKSQKYSGTFMVGSRVSGLPRAEVFKGLLIVDQEDHFIHIWNARNAFFIATNSTQFTTDWVRIGTTDAAGNIIVGEGYGAFLGDAVSAIAEHRKGDNRYGFVVYSNEEVKTRYKVFQDIGGVISQFDLYHTGNAPYEIATAELI